MTAIERKIYLIRGHKVMLDADLAGLYQVATKNLNKAVRRNLDRFPADFMFQLTGDETDDLRFQIGTSRWGGRRYFPYAFTEHGVAMLSSVLQSKRAIQLNILIVRAFIQLREMFASHKDLARRVHELDQQQKQQGQEISTIFALVKQLIAAPRRRVGFPTSGAIPGNVKT
ncbi:MAG TPA: ORF6N domain-containing protein [Bryobacteraceae bacterium]|nr:ORF6N domain-containing protein [Bryobacteraceae bacterium]